MKDLDFWVGEFNMAMGMLMDGASYYEIKCRMMDDVILQFTNIENTAATLIWAKITNVLVDAYRAYNNL